MNSPLSDGVTFSEKTEVTQSASAHEQEYDAEEEQKVLEVDPQEKIDEIAAETKTNLVKLEKKSVDGPDEKVLIGQITDFSDFKLIDKLDKDTYISNQHKTY